MIKMRQGDNLKLHRLFRNRLAKVSSCGDDVSALAFIGEMQVSHPLYKYLLKHDVTQISKVCLEPNLIFSWRKLWRILSTTLSNTTMMERRWTRSARPWPMPTTRIWGNLPSRSSYSLFSFWIYPEPSEKTILHLAEAPH